MEGYLALIKEQREENDKLKKQLQQKDNIINELYNLFCQLDSEIMKRNYAKANKINFIIRNKLKQLKEEGKE